MWKAGICKCCPECGGEIVVYELYQYSMAYRVLKSGRISKQCKKVDSGPMDARIASCVRCGHYWDMDSFDIQDGFFVDLD